MTDECHVIYNLFELMLYVRVHNFSDVEKFSWVLCFLVFLSLSARLSSGPFFPTFPYFFDLLYFSLLFHENALLSLFFHSAMPFMG